MKKVEGGEIILYKGQPAIIIGYSPVGTKDVIIKPLTDEGKNKCHNCGEPQTTQFHIIEGCNLWNESVEPVKTL